METVSFQRKNSKSNAHVGKEFEDTVMKVFLRENIEINKNISIEIGNSKFKKNHSFDLGINSDEDKILIECKSHKWTEGENIPSAKLTVWNEAMYYFSLAPNDFRKLFVVLKDFSEKRNETLADYYIRNSKHLIPVDVEIYELDGNTLELSKKY